MITIYYPYWEAGSKWNELRYSLRSLEKHLKEDFKVCIVGDCPGWLKVSSKFQERQGSALSVQIKESRSGQSQWSEGMEHGAGSWEHGAGSSQSKTDAGCFVVPPRNDDGVMHIPYQRDMNHSSLWNTNKMMELLISSKFQVPSFKLQGAEISKTDAGCRAALAMTGVASASPRNDGRVSVCNDGDLFVRMYDDIYFLRDMTVEELKVTRIIRNAREVRQIASGSETWRKQIFRTIDELEQREYMGYLTESHCPEVFSARNMKLIYQQFNLEEQELLTSTLYYNVFPFAQHINDKKTQRALFYGEENDYSFSSHDVAKKCEGKWFLNHNDSGLNEELRGFIEERFSEKSRFEI